MSVAPDKSGKVIPADPALSNGWEVGGVNTQLRGGHLLNMLARTLARLEALRVVINDQNKELMERAARLHDHHGETADALREELSGMDSGEQPALEDAYASRLTDRRKADDLMSLLHHQTTNFRSKTDPVAYRNPQAVPPGFATPDNGQSEQEEEAE
jgi:hypothetical protein